MKPVPLVAAAALALWTAARWRSRSNGQRAGGLLVVAALVVYGVGLVHPPSLEESITSVGKTLGPYTYALVGIMAFLETGAFVGLVAPGELTILVGGLVAGQGRISVVVLLAIVWFAAVAGDVTSYMLGRRLGRDFLVRHGPRVTITPDRLERVEGFFDEHGGATILLGRFVGLVRAIAPFVAGASRLPFRRFLPFDVVGAGLWGSTFVLLGYAFWRSFDRVVAVAKQGALALGAVIVVIAGAIAGFRFLRVPENRRRAADWLDARMDRPGLRPLNRAGRAAHARALRPAAHASAGPLHFARDRFTPGELGLELTSLLAITLVGGFAFGVLASAVADNSPPLDGSAARLAGDLRVGGVVDGAKVITALGSLPVLAGVVGLTVAFLLVRRERLEAAVVALGTILVSVASPVAKAAEGRPRPAHPLVAVEGSAFPSGHASHAVAYVAIAVALGRVLPGLGARFAVVLAGVLVAAAIGLTRVYLGVHYLSDVLGGWALGAAVFSLCGMVALLVDHERHTVRAT